MTTGVTFLAFKAFAGYVHLRVALRLAVDFTLERSKCNRYIIRLGSLTVRVEVAQIKEGERWPVTSSLPRSVWQESAGSDGWDALRS